MCNDCDKTTNCFEVDTGDCNKGCEDVLSTDCIFHNILNDNQSSKLYNIGVTKGTSLSRILKSIDEKLSQLLTSDFSKYDMNGLNIENNIFNIKDFVFQITKKVKELEEKNADVVEITDQLNDDLSDLTEQVEAIVNIGISNSELNINNTDSIEVVLNKIIAGLTTLEVIEYESDDTASIKMQISNGVISADVKISDIDANIISIQDDGLYATHQSTTAILKSINDSAALQKTFTGLVNKGFPSFSFDIMAATNQIVKYINILGEEVPVTAKANTLLKLTDVKRIVSVPSTNLTITFKGIS